jgi:chaperonin GroEL
MKEIFFDKELQEKLFTGVEKLFKAVSSTFGPNGRTVILKPKDAKIPVVTKDGFTVASFIELNDPIENIGADFVRKAAEKTAQIAGDATTTTTILAYHLYRVALERVKNGLCINEVIKDIDDNLKIIIKKLYEMKKEVVNREDLYKVALISTNNDKELADLVATAWEAIGADGSINLKHGKLSKCELEIVDGFKLNSGYHSSKFLPPNSDMIKIQKEFCVLISNEKISWNNTVAGVLATIVETKFPLVVIAPEYEEQFISICLLHKGNVVLMNMPHFSQDRDNVIDDLSVFLNAKIFDSKNGNSFSNFNLKDLGIAQSLELSKSKAIFVNGNSNPELIKEKIEQLKAELRDTEDEVEQRKINYRINNICATVATIYVGGNSELDITERKHRAEDAIFACASAIKDGIVPGCGAALYLIAEALGGSAWVPVLRSPLEALVFYSGGQQINPGDLSPGTCLDLQDNCKKVDAYNAGILDVTLAVGTAVTNAASVVKLLLLSNCGIVEIDNKQEKREK